MRLFLILAIIAILNLPVMAIDNYTLENENRIQTLIDNIGTNILNKNKIDKRIIFTYDDKHKRNFYLQIKGFQNAKLSYIKTFINLHKQTMKLRLCYHVKFQLL